MIAFIRGIALRPFPCQTNHLALLISRAIRSQSAGVWDCWKDLSGNAVETCSIMTTTPNALTSAVHNRMPVILEPDNYDLWLNPGMRDVAAASELLKPCDAKLMRYHPVSSRVNHVANDDAGCSKPMELAQIQSGLFS